MLSLNFHLFLFSYLRLQGTNQQIIKCKFVLFIQINFSLWFTLAFEEWNYFISSLAPGQFCMKTPLDTKCFHIQFIQIRIIKRTRSIFSSTASSTCDEEANTVKKNFLSRITWTPNEKEFKLQFPNGLRCNSWFYVRVSGEKKRARNSNALFIQVNSIQFNSSTDSLPSI